MTCDLIEHNKGLGRNPLVCPLNKDFCIAWNPKDETYWKCQHYNDQKE